MEPTTGKRIVSKGAFWLIFLMKEIVMKRDSAVATFIGATGALYYLSFPYWTWDKRGEDDTYSCRHERAFILSPPAASAEIELYEPLLYSGLVISLTAGTLLIYRSRKRDKEAAVFWQAKWDYTDTSKNSLLRASAEPIQAQEAVLLRAVTEEQPGHEEQLLRAAAGKPDAG